MLRSIHLILAALAMLVSLLAMQSGMVMAAMPMDHHEMAQSGHCGDENSDSEDGPVAMTQCCVAMCSAVVPLGAASLDPVMYHAPLLFGPHLAAHSAFLAKLPTPPPRAP